MSVSVYILCIILASQDALELTLFTESASGVLTLTMSDHLFYTNTFLDQKILHSKVRKLATKIASRQNSVNFDKNYLAAKWRKLWEKWHTVCNITTLCVELYNTLCVKKLHSWLHRFVCDVWISDYKQTFSFQSRPTKQTLSNISVGVKQIKGVRQISKIESLYCFPRI